MTKDNPLPDGHECDRSCCALTKGRTPTPKPTTCRTCPQHQTGRVVWGSALLDGEVRGFAEKARKGHRNWLLT